MPESKHGELKKIAASISQKEKKTQQPLQLREEKKNIIAKTDLAFLMAKTYFPSTYSQFLQRRYEAIKVSSYSKP